MKYSRIEAATVRQQAYGRWLEIIQYVAPGLFDEALDKLGKHVDCPLHGGKKDFRFIARAPGGKSTTAETGVAMCTCGPFSDGFALLMAATGKSFYTVLTEVHECLNGRSSESRTFVPRIPIRAQPSKEELEKQNAEILNRVHNLWDAGKAVPLSTIPYYAQRGLNVDLLNDVKDVRTMASLGYFVFENNQLQKLGSYPAMLALMRDAKGAPVAVHRTWLSTDKKDKAPVEKAKKLSESPGVAGAAIRLFEAEGSEVLGLAEGIETALAARQLAASGHWSDLTDMPIWATFAERNIRNFQIPASLDSTLKKIVIFADNDESNVGLTAAKTFKDRMKQERPELIVDIKLPPVVGWDWLDALINIQD